MNGTTRRIMIAGLAMVTVLGTATPGDSASPPQAAAKKSFGQLTREVRQTIEEVDKSAPAVGTVVKKPKKVLGGNFVGVNANEAQWAPFIQQYQQQLRPVLQSELRLVRLMFDLKPEQRPQIKAAGEAALEAAAKKVVAAQFGGNGGIFPGGGFGGGIRRSKQDEDDYHTIIDNALVKALEPEVGPLQLAHYRDELTKRTANRKRAAILSVVSRLDSLLLLTAEQRDEIAQQIAGKWQRSWEEWLALQHYASNYFPQELDPIVRPVLNDDQKPIWKSVNKGMFGSMMWAAQMHMQDKGDDAWWDEKPAKPKGGKP